MKTRRRPNQSLQPTAALVFSDVITNAISFAQFYSRSHRAVIRVYFEMGNVIETHEHEGEFKEP
jgi:hypothetical protein